MEGKSLNEWANHLKVRSFKVLLRAVPLSSDTKQTAKKTFYDPLLYVCVVSQGGCSPGGCRVMCRPMAKKSCSEQRKRGYALH